MKTAKLFLAGIYLHLFLSAITPIGILLAGEWNPVSYGLFFFYLLMIGAMQLTGWICVGCSIAAYRKGYEEKLKKSVKILKLYSIPFYLLNFIVSFVYWFFILAGSRGILFFLLPIPIAITCLIIFQTGCVGICYIMYLRKQLGSQKKPSRTHYLIQLIPILDVISTLYIFHKS
ncbi:MAG: hypothetical protein Q4E24_16500 [bacterium]|nr:hypothetical protein [bacterium]